MNKNSTDDELLEKIGELYFRSNGIELKCRSSQFIKLIWFFTDCKFAFFNPISIFLNIVFVSAFIYFYRQNVFYNVISLVIAIFLLVFEAGIFVPAYFRKTSAELIKLHYRLIGMNLIRILKPSLHNFLCNGDGTVKDFAAEVIVVMFSNYLGNVICSTFGITIEIIQLIILYLTNQGLKDFCSIIPTPIANAELEWKLQMLKDEMRTIEKSTQQYK